MLCYLFSTLQFNQSTCSGITTQTDNQIQYTSLHIQFISRKNVRMFYLKRAHVLNRMNARFK